MDSDIEQRITMLEMQMSLFMKALVQMREIHSQFVNERHTDYTAETQHTHEIKIDYSTKGITSAPIAYSK